MKKTYKIIITIILVLLSIFLFYVFGDMFNEFLIESDWSGLEYTVNEDGMTCTVTGIGTYKSNTLHLDNTVAGYYVTEISDSAFENTNLKFVYLPSYLKKIEKRAFSGCTSLISVYGLEECRHLEMIGDYAFEKCSNMDEIILPDSLNSIGKFAFSKCYDLKAIRLSNNLISIGEYAFQGCVSLKEIVLPETLESIGSSAFESCRSLSEIHIPVSTDSIGIMAFAGCYQLNCISVDNSNGFYSSQCGNLYNKDATILIQVASTGNYNEFFLPEGIVKIESYALRGVANITSITIPKSIKQFGSWIIYDAPKLQAINYEGTVEEWVDILKAPDWYEGSSDFTIYCTDGQISKDGTVTYN